MALLETDNEPLARPALMYPVLCTIDSYTVSGDKPPRYGEVRHPKTRPYYAENIPCNPTNEAVRLERNRSSVRSSGGMTGNDPLSEITKLMKSIDLDSSAENRQFDPFTTIDAFQEEEVESVRDERVEELGYAAHWSYLIDAMNSSHLLQTLPEPSEHVLDAIPFEDNHSGNGKKTDHKRHCLSVNVTAAKRWKYVGYWLRRKTCSGYNRVEGNQTKEMRIVAHGHGSRMNVVVPPERSESNCLKNIKNKKHVNSLRKVKNIPKASVAIPRTVIRISSNRREVMVHRIIKIHDLLRLTPVSLHTAVYYFDIALSKLRPSRNEVELVAACCLHIASKRRERFPPSVYRYVAAFNNSFTATDLTGMEQWLILVLRRKHRGVTPYACLGGVLNHLASRRALDARFEHIAHYAIEVALGDRNYKRFPPYHVAVSAACFAACSTSHPLSWEDIEQLGTGSFSMVDISNCVSYLGSRVYYDLVEDDPDKQEVKKKYAQLDHGRITAGDRRSELLEFKRFSELAWPPLENELLFDNTHLTLTL